MRGGIIQKNLSLQFITIESVATVYLTGHQLTAVQVTLLQSMAMKLGHFHRFLFYGLHGLLDEIVFTSLHDSILVERDFSLKGHSSIWAFFIYGTGSLVVEYIYRKWSLDKLNFLLRGIAYVAIAFFWEFNTGLLLKQFAACPWDYTHKDYDFMGLITLDYAPLWCMAGFYQEYLTKFLDSLRITSNEMAVTGDLANGVKPKHE